MACAPSRCFSPSGCDETDSGRASHRLRLCRGPEVGELCRGRVGLLLLPAPGAAMGIRPPAGARAAGAGGAVAQRAADVCSGGACAVGDRAGRDRPDLSVGPLDRHGACSWPLGGIGAAALVVPLFGALLIWGTFLAGSRFGARVGVASAGLAACSPVFLYQLVQPMSDVPAAACWMLAVAAVTGTRRNGSALGGLAAATAILIRPNLVPLAAPLGVFLLWRPERRWRQRLPVHRDLRPLHRRGLPRGRGDSTHLLRLRAELRIRNAGGDLQPRSSGAECPALFLVDVRGAHAGLDDGRGRAVPAAGCAHASFCRAGPRQCRVLPAVRRLRSLVVPAISAADAAARRDHGGGSGRCDLPPRCAGDAPRPARRHA